MFVLTFERGLLPLKSKTPALPPLFQLPPRNARPAIIGLSPVKCYLEIFIQPPNMRPISLSCLLHISYFLIGR